MTYFAALKLYGTLHDQDLLPMEVIKTGGSFLLTFNTMNTLKSQFASRLVGQYSTYSTI